MTVIATDNFNRSDETPLAGNWIHPAGAGTFNLVSSNVLQNTTSTDTYAYYNAVVPADQYSQVVIATAGNGNGGPAVRMATGALTLYAFIEISGQLTIGKIIAGSFEVLEQAVGNFVDGDVARLEVQGTTLRAYLNGVLAVTTADGDIASGRSGLFAYELGDLTGGFNDFEMGDFTSLPSGAAVGYIRA